LTRVEFRLASGFNADLTRLRWYYNPPPMTDRVPCCVECACLLIRLHTLPYPPLPFILVASQPRFPPAFVCVGVRCVVNGIETPRPNLRVDDHRSWLLILKTKCVRDVQVDGWVFTRANARELDRRSPAGLLGKNRRQSLIWDGTGWYRMVSDGMARIPPGGPVFVPRATRIDAKP